MAVKVPCANAFVKRGEYSLNVTLRDYPGSELLLACKEGESPDPMAMAETLSQIVTDTINNWFLVVNWLKGETVADNRKSPEGATLMITPENEDPLVTVWGKYMGLSLTVVSNEAPIYAYRAMKAWSAGVVAAGCKWETGKAVSVEQKVKEQEAHANPFNQTQPQMAQEQQRRIGAPQPPDTLVEAGKQMAQQMAGQVVPTDVDTEGIKAVNCKTIKCKTVQSGNNKGKLYYVAGGVPIWDTSHLKDVVEAGIPVDKLTSGLSIDMTQYPELAVKVHYVVDAKGFRKFMGLEVGEAQQFAPPPQQSGHPF